MKTSTQQTTNTTAPVATSAGIFVAEFSPRGLAQLHFPKHAAPRRVSAPLTVAQKRWVKNLASELDRYLAGKRVRFTVPLDVQSGTPFQRRVWRGIAQIPWGQTRSYAELAARAGNRAASRAAGAACGANPVPIVVPCHRVVASDGSLGGFGGGLAWKRKLLKLES
jgi:O-6-methylguanine DNA methyltransferase